MFSDPVTITAAVVGGVVGIVLLIKFGGWRLPPKESPPVTRPPALPTGYVSTARPTAAPVLIAAGLTLLGVGVVLSTAGFAPGPLAVAPGGGFLLLAIVVLLRGQAPAEPNAARTDNNEEDEPV